MRFTHWHRRVLKVLEAMKETTTIYETHRTAYRFPPDASARLIALECEIAQDTARLTRAYHVRAMVLFHYTMKQHHTVHAALVSRFTNPCHGDCSSGEDLMKVAKALIKGASHGNGPLGTSNRAMSKYMKALHIIIDNERQWWR